MCACCCTWNGAGRGPGGSFVTGWLPRFRGTIFPTKKRRGPTAGGPSVGRPVYTAVLCNHCVLAASQRACVQPHKRGAHAPLAQGVSYPAGPTMRATPCACCAPRAPGGPAACCPELPPAAHATPLLQRGCPQTQLRTAAAGCRSCATHMQQPAPRGQAGALGGMHAAAHPTQLEPADLG